MKEKLYTIELTDAVNAGDECCFCWLERKLEQENLEFVLGSSYMESDIREQTSRSGFCRRHTKMMFDYGNTVGNAWILKSRMEYMRKQFARYAEAKDWEAPGRTGEGGLLGRLKGKQASGKRLLPASRAAFAEASEDTCYICGRMKAVYERMLDTFVYMLKNDPAFADKLLSSKGFCLRHFADAAGSCKEAMKPEEYGRWMEKLSRLMEDNLNRIQEDIDWLIEKFDYRNQDADWKQSKDAVQRTMQKLTGGYPADPVFRDKK